MKAAGSAVRSWRPFSPCGRLRFSGSVSSFWSLVVGLFSEAQVFVALRKARSALIRFRYGTRTPCLSVSTRVIYSCLSSKCYL